MDETTIITLLQQPEFLIGVLSGLLLAALVFFLITSFRRPPETFEAFANESGKVLVSRHALQEQIQRCCEELSDVGRTRATVIQKNDVISIRLRLRVKSNARLVGISGYLQEQIDSVLRTNIGVQNIGPIDIVVTGILPEPEGEPATSIKPEEKAAD